MPSTVRSLVLAVATVVAAGGVTLAGATSDASPPPRWPVWGGDLHNSHFAAGETQISADNVAQLRPQWTFSTLGDVYAIPTVQNGAVYLLDAGLPLLPGWPGTKLRALDGASGRELWSKS